MLFSSLLFAAVAAPALAQVEISKSIQLQDSKFCIHNKDGNQSDGNRLQISKCDGSEHQQWNWEPLLNTEGKHIFNIKLDGTDKCLAYQPTEQGSSNPPPIVLAACNADPDAYGTKFKWGNNAAICSAGPEPDRPARCIGIEGREPAEGVTLGLQTTNHAGWVTPK